jgi:hypothetical protein
MGRPLGSQNKEWGAVDKPWRIGAIITDKNMQLWIKVRALVDGFSYDELVKEALLDYLDSPSRNPERFKALTSDLPPIDYVRRSPARLKMKF